MFPPAPGRLSMMTASPHFSPSFSATIHAITSLLDPALKPNTTRTVLVGYDCALAGTAGIDRAPNKAAHNADLPIGIILLTPSRAPSCVPWRQLCPTVAAS